MNPITVKAVLFTILIFSSLLSFQTLKAQNIENLGKEKPIKISGGVSVNQMFFGAIGSPTRRNSYTYYLSGNLNFSLYGWSVPLSYMYSNQQSSFQQPFNQYSISPTYKWITAHIGYSSMTFSPYTLSGHQFLGAGVELNPGTVFKFSAMLGRLQKAIEYDTTNRSIQPTYRRMGYAFKAGVNLKVATIVISTFHSKDFANSLVHPVDTLQLYPEENLAFGVSSTVSFIPKLSLMVDYGSSYITRDTRSALETGNSLLTRYTSTEHFNAIKTGVKYAQPFFSMGITYERIDPGYRTHGSYYFNNDLENITGNISTNLINNKLNLGVNLGVQRDDLDHKKMSNMVRIVNSFNVGYVPTGKLNINASYSNFKSHTNVKSQFVAINQLTSYETLDTLNFTQISENTTTNVNYALASNENNRQYLSFNGVYQKASEYQAQVLTNSGAKFLNLNTGYNYTFVKSNTGLTTSLNFSSSNSLSLKSITIGPTFSIRKNFFNNKLRNSFTTSYNNSYSNGALISTIVNFRVNEAYTWMKKHNLNLCGAVIYRNVKMSENTLRYTEFTATLGYSYNF